MMGGYGGIGSGGMNNASNVLLKKLVLYLLDLAVLEYRLVSKRPSLVAAARSTALEGADTVLLLGARLNWMLHFGQPPRWSQRQPPAIIQVSESTIGIFNRSKYTRRSILSYNEVINYHEEKMKIKTLRQTWTVWTNFT